MTTNDGLLEFNLVNVYQMYENFNINVELGYIANFMDGDTWRKDYPGWGDIQQAGCLESPGHFHLQVLKLVKQTMRASSIRKALPQDEKPFAK